MNRPLYKYALSTPDSSDGNGYFVLEYLPSNYEGIDYSLKRSERDGIIYDIILGLKFVKDGKSFLEYQFAAKSTYAKVFCHIYKYNVTNGIYEPYYRGRVDFTTANQSFNYFGVNLESQSLQTTILNNLDTKYDITTYIDSNGDEQSSEQDVTFRAKVIPTQTIGVAESTIFDDFTNSSLRPAPSYEFLYAPIDFNSTNINEFNSTSINELNVFKYPVFLNKTSLLNNEQYVFEAQKAGQMFFDINFNFQFFNETGGDESISVVRLSIFKRNKINTSSTVITSYDVPYNAVITNPSFTSGGGYLASNYAISEDISMEEGDRIYMQIFIQYTGLEGQNISHYYQFENLLGDKTTVNLQFNALSENSIVKSVPYYEAMLGILQKITGETDILRSDYFGREDTPIFEYNEDGEGSLGVYTDGNRLIGDNSEPIFMSLNEILDDLNLKHSIGMNLGTELVSDSLSVFEQFKTIVRIEPRSYFYEDSESVNLLNNFNSGRSKPIKYFENVTKEPANEYVFSKIDINYPNVSLNGLSLLDEFISERKFRTKADQSTRSYSLKTTVKNSGYDIETQRTRSLEKDDNRDDDIYSSAIVRISSVFNTERNEIISSPTGIISPTTSMNLRYAPRYVLNTYHLPWLSTSQVGINAVGLSDESDDIVFSGGKLNYTCTIGGNQENAPIASAGTPILMPWKYTVEVPLDNETFQTIRNNPLKYISLRVFENGVAQTVKGYILDMELTQTNNYKDVFKITIIRKA